MKKDQSLFQSLSIFTLFIYEENYMYIHAWFWTMGITPQISWTYFQFFGILVKHSKTGLNHTYSTVLSHTEICLHIHATNCTCLPNVEGTKSDVWTKFVRRTLDIRSLVNLSTHSLKDTPEEEGLNSGMVTFPSRG